MTNMDKLYEAVEARGPVCVGLDTDFSYLPADFVDSTLSKGENIVRFNKKLIDATKAVAGCYKVQIAYYESLGLEGLKAYADTLKAVREAGVPVIADIKRGDIAKTAEMYAMGHFTGDFEADFVTLAPYMGLDSISPYLPYAEKQGKGMFVLCRTSNGGAKDFEYEKLADGRHVYDLVGDKLNALGKDYMGEHGYSSIGLVIGGTRRTISPLRKIRPTPSPPAMPTSASRASPGPLTAQPMTATFRFLPWMFATRRSTSAAMPIRSMRVRPQVGQDTTLMPSSLSPTAFKMAWAA